MFYSVNSLSHSKLTFLILALRQPIKGFSVLRIKLVPTRFHSQKRKLKTGLFRETYQPYTSNIVV